MFATSQMPPKTSERRLWRFGNCEFSEQSYELRVAGRLVDLERKPLDVLRHLLIRNGEVVGKEELLESVWPGVLVVDASLATAVSKLRKVLGEEDVIQTVPKVGYRISVPVLCSFPGNGQVRLITQETPTSREPEPLIPAGRTQQSRNNLRSSLLWSIIGLALLAAVSVGIRISRNAARRRAMPARVAILPFQNASGSQALDYLRSALPDEVANTLSAAHSLIIRPVSAAARFSGPGVDFRKAGQQLDASRIIAGHFAIIGDRLQVTMEAVDTDEDRIVWDETLSVPSNNLLALQEQVAAVARGKLSQVLGVTEFVPEVAPRATNEEAYELYLKSVALDLNPRPNKEGIELLRRAVLLDPNYAPAWGLLSLRYYTDARFGGGGPQMLAFSDAAAEKELSLNPDSLDSMAELTIHRTERGELVKAHQVAHELLKRKPEDPNLHHVLSYVLRYGGSLEEAGRECELTVLLAQKVVWGSCSTTFMELGNYKRAMDFVRKDLSSEWSRAHAIEVRLREGKADEAVRIPAPEIPHWDSYQMLLACARKASQSEIRALAAKVEVDDDPEVDYFFSGHLAYCGQTAAALKMLQVAIDRNYCSYPAMDKDPFFDGLRMNAEFQKLRNAGIACHANFVANLGSKAGASESTRRQ